ncbi:MAG: hypothetical protein EZS28_021538 [Streblomastix strix]|uniref:Uncharacterized protein n=1 Tax=Streblomastix strix TaxID=222440 RepID=A0A5J4VKD4_9EUKA|nr:MAG: hypothetical protein EZS28_021538 [Streblomastix strix]
MATSSKENHSFTGISSKDTNQRSNELFNEFLQLTGGSKQLIEDVRSSWRTQSKRYAHELPRMPLLKKLELQKISFSRETAKVNSEEEIWHLDSLQHYLRTISKRHNLQNQVILAAYMSFLLLEITCNCHNAAHTSNNYIVMLEFKVNFKQLKFEQQHSLNSLNLDLPRQKLTYGRDIQDHLIMQEDITINPITIMLRNFSKTFKEVSQCLGKLLRL